MIRLNIFLFISSLLLSFSASSSVMVDGFSSTKKDLFIADLASIKEKKDAPSNKWIHKKIGFLSGSGGSTYDWISRNMGLIVGDEFQFKGCTVEPDDSLPQCIGENTSQDGYLNGLKSLSLPDRSYSLVLVGDFFNDNNIDGGILLSGGIAKRINGEKDVVSMISFQSDKEVSIDDYSDRAYRIAHYMGLVRLKTMYEANINGISICRDLYGNDFYCDNYSNGAIAFTGMMLRDLAYECEKCSENGLVYLYYVSAEYLLSSSGDPDTRSIARNILKKYKNKFIEMGLNYELLEKRYRWSLTQNN